MPIRLLLLALLLPLACESSNKETEKEEEPSFRPPPLASQLPGGAIHKTSRATSFADMLEELAKTDVVFVGEDPASADHHLLQLKVIEYLLDRGRLHAVGMEMFQRKFQPVLDEYVGNRIDAEELRERTEWDSRWPHAFGLYRPILEYARKNRIPLVALSVEAEIAEKVKEGGLDALSPQERKTMPPLVSAPGAEGFDFMVNEVMADVVVRWFLTAPKDAQIVVLTGNAAIANKFRVPARVRDRNGKNYKTIVPISADAPNASYAEKHADFVWVPGAK